LSFHAVIIPDLFIENFLDNTKKYYEGWHDKE